MPFNRGTFSGFKPEPGLLPEYMASRQAANQGALVAVDRTRMGAARLLPGATGQTLHFRGGLPAWAGSGLFDICDFGAVANYKSGTDGAMASGSTTLTSASANFTPADIGKPIGVYGAGVISSTVGTNFVSTITAVNSATSVTLADANASGGAVAAAYYGYGTDNLAAIQSAVTACVAAGGGRVRVPNGNFAMSIAGNPLLIQNPYVEIVGNGRSSWLFAISSSTTHIIKFLNTDHVGVRELCVGSVPSQARALGAAIVFDTCNYFWAEDCEVNVPGAQYGCRSLGIFTTVTSGAVAVGPSIIANNTLVNCMGGGILVEGVRDYVIANNTVINPGDDGISPQGISSILCARGTITGNTVFNSADRGIYVSGVDGLSITGNTVQLSFAPALAINDAQGVDHRIAVVGNTFIGGGGGTQATYSSTIGLPLGACAGIYFHNASGLLVDQMVISDNVVANSKASHIVGFGLSSAQPNNIKVDNNLFYSTAALLSAALLTGQTAPGGTGTVANADGCYFTQLQNFSFCGNTIVHSNHYNLQLATGMSGMLLVKGNIMDFYGEQGNVVAIQLGTLTAPFTCVIDGNIIANSNGTATGNVIALLSMAGVVCTNNILPSGKAVAGIVSTQTIRGNVNFNPQGAATLATAASPWTYTNNDGVDEMIEVWGVCGTGTGSISISKNSIVVYSVTALATTADYSYTAFLQPGEAFTVTYTLGTGGSINASKDRK